MDLEIKSVIESYSSRLPNNKSISVPEAESKAGAFLEAMAFITDRKHLLSEDKIKLTSIQSATYSEELFKGTSKTMTENKILAEASEEYKAAREALEYVENDIAYLKAYYDIYMAAHVFYRNMAKGESYG